ncbi:hypothetical protein LXL04_008906 [Taraxacum kok-saghyz]
MERIRSEVDERESAVADFVSVGGDGGRREAEGGRVDLEKRSRWVKKAGAGMSSTKIPGSSSNEYLKYCEDVRTAGNDVGTLSASTKGKDKNEDMVKEKTTKTMKSEKLGKYTFICVFELFTVFCLGVIEYHNNSTFKDTDNEINDDHIVIAGQDFWIPTVPEDINPKEDGCYTSREAIEEIYYTYAHVIYYNIFVKC